MAYQLTGGAILDTYNNKTDGHPVLQVIDIKSLPGNSGGANRYRLVVSDGVHYQQAMLATQMNNLVESGKIAMHCIIQLAEYICNVVSNRRIVIILNVTVVDPGPGQQISNPSNVENAQQQQQQQQTPAAPQQPQFQAQPAAVPSYMNKGASNNSARTFHPIASLNPYQNRWTIKARVTSKSDIRTWNNARGEGKLFSVDLLDASGGQIRATMFNDAADKFFNVLKENEVYIISRGNLKLANKRFSHVPNEYELTLNADAEVEYVGQDTEIEAQKFDFVSIDKIVGINADEYLDIIGVASNITPVAKIVSQKTQKELTKRTITLTDSSLVAVDVTVWGDMAEKYNEENINQVIAIKTVRVSDFGGKSLNTTFGSHIFINPDCPDAHNLRQWYDTTGKGATVESISKGRAGGSGSDPRKTFAEVKEERLGFNEKPDYFVVKGTVTFYRHELEKPPWYNACPTPECNKKVTQNDPNGLWFCEKCDKSYPECVPRYILSLLCCDATGSTWLTAFNEVATALLGKTALEVQAYKDSGADQSFESVFQDANFKSFMFKIRAKAENRDDEVRVRCHVVSATPIDYRKESASLLDQIAAYA